MRTLKRAPLLLLTVLFSSITLVAQVTGKVLFISDYDCSIIIDGETEIELINNVPQSINLSEGQHLLQNVALGTNEVIEVPANKQLVYNVSKTPEETEDKGGSTVDEESRVEPSDETTIVADINLSIPGGFTLGVHAMNEGDYETSGIPIMYYFFQDGDEITMNIAGLNKKQKGTYSIEVYSYPDWNKVYSSYKFDSLNNKTIPISRDGIYVIEIGTNYAFDRKVSFKLDRKSGDLANMKSARVEKRRDYSIESVQSPTSLWVNSTSNETWKGGKSRITMSIALPENTVEWYYIFTASRSEEQTTSVINNANLVGELTSLIASAGTTALFSIGAELITSPPGGDYCDIYLLDMNNRSLFESGAQFSFYPEGSRSNIMSGKVSVGNHYGSHPQIGFRNTDSYHGISVGIEIAALVYEEYYAQVDE